MAILINNVKHIHYHVHYHDLNRTLSSTEDNLDREVLPEPADISNWILKQEEETPLSFLPWHPKLPRRVSQGLLDYRLEGETVLWAGAPNPSVLKKSYYRRKKALVISLIITILCVVTLPLDLLWAVLFWVLPGPLLICYDVYIIALFVDVCCHKHDYYVITPTRVLFFYEDNTFDHSLHLQDNVFWKVRYSKDDMGTIQMEDKIASEFRYSLYLINGYRYVKHLLLSLLVKVSAINAKTTPDIPRLTYCPQCGYNLGKVQNSP